MTSTPTRKQTNGRPVLTDEQKRTRDGVLMQIGLTVWYFDPYANGVLKSALIADINSHGPELRTDRGTLAYSRRAVWAQQFAAVENGPPHEVYTYSRLSSNTLAGV